MARRIFVSHSSKDNDFGKALTDWLRSQLGPDYEIWYDSLGEPGADGLWQGGLDPARYWQDQIQARLMAADVFVVILSPDALDSAWVQDELRIAWSRKNDRDKAGLVIVPVLRETCEVPPWLTHIQWINFTGGPPGDPKSWAALLSAARDTRNHMTVGEIEGPPFDLGLLLEPPRFVGRVADLEWVMARLRAGGATAITALRGMGGIGKSALAAVAIRRLYEEGAFPDGMAVVLCENQRDAATVLRQALSRFTPGRREPDAEDLADLAALAQRTLAGKRALIALDNVEPELDIARVAAPLAAAGATLLLTARQTLPTAVVPVAGARRLDLLSEGEALELFARNYGRDSVAALSADERAAAARIVATLERHTLAVRLAGAYAAEMGRPLATVAVEIAQDAMRIPEGETPRKVEAVLARSVRALPDDGRRLFAALAAFASGEFGRQAALALGAGLSLPNPEASLDLLIRRALLDSAIDATLAAPADAERLRLHPLLRIGSATLLKAWPAPQQDAAQRALAAWYAGYMPAVNNSSQTGYLALTPDEDNITGALDWALAHGEDRTAARICHGMRGFWRDTGRTRAGLHYLPLGAAAAQRVADVSGERADSVRQANITAYLGDILKNTGRLADAETIFTQDLALRRAMNARQDEGIALSRLGQIAQQRGDLAAAERYFQQSLAIRREVSDRRGEGVDLYYLALLSEQRGAFDAAERFHRESLQVAVDMGSNLDIAPSLLMLGRFLIVRRGKRDEGMRMLHEAARLYDEMGIPGGDDARAAIRELGGEG